MINFNQKKFEKIIDSFDDISLEKVRLKIFIFNLNQRAFKIFDFSLKIYFGNSRDVNRIKSE